MLEGIGSGILKDLESSWRESTIVQAPGGQQERPEKIHHNRTKNEEQTDATDVVGDSTLDAFSSSRRVRQIEPR